MLALAPQSADATIIGTGSFDPDPITNPVKDSLTIGITKNGSVRVGGGSALVVNDNVVVGATDKSTDSTFRLFGAKSSLEVGGNLEVGKSGVGTFNQDNGTAEVTGNVNLGDFKAGTYNLNRGTLTAAVTNVGVSDKGTFNQTGGTNTVTASLVVGLNMGSEGTYVLSKGKLESGEAVVGAAGNGTFEQKGGEFTAGTLLVGRCNEIVACGNEGQYTLDRGTLTVNGNTDVGQYTTGKFIQNGGSHDIGMNLVLGRFAKGDGTYELNGGELTISGQETIAVLGTGHFSQSDGKNTVHGELVLGDGAGSTGTMEVTGGTLQVDSSIVVGEAGTGEFTYSGGTVKSGGLVVGEDGSGTATLSGKDAKMTVDGSAFVGQKKGSGKLVIEEGAQLTLTDANKIQIGGSANKNGRGDVFLTGDGSTLKATVVNVGGAKNSSPGLLDLGAGTKADGTVNINPTGTLKGEKGDKEVSKSVINTGGTLLALPGELTIGGTYVQDANAKLGITLEGRDAGEFGHLAIAETATIAEGTEVDFTFTDFLPKKGDMIEFLTSAGLNLAASMTNCADFVLTCEAFGVADGFDFDVESTKTSLILIAENDAKPVSEPGSALVFCAAVLGLAVVRLRREVIGSL